MFAPFNLSILFLFLEFFFFSPLPFLIIKKYFSLENRYFFSFRFPFILDQLARRKFSVVLGKKSISRRQVRLRAL